MTSLRSQAILSNAALLVAIATAAAAESSRRAGGQGQTNKMAGSRGA